jgi:hypothetical protein
LQNTPAGVTLGDVSVSILNLEAFQPPAKDHVYRNALLKRPRVPDLLQRLSLLALDGDQRRQSAG